MRSQNWQKIQGPPKQKNLKGKKLYRLRVGNYRVIYDIQDNLMLIFAVKLGH